MYFILDEATILLCMFVFQSDFEFCLAENLDGQAAVISNTYFEIFSSWDYFLNYFSFHETNSWKQAT